MSKPLTCGECLHIGYCLIRAIARDVEVLRNNECPARTRERELLNVLTAIDNYVYNHEQEGTWNLEVVQAMARKTLQEIEG